MATLIVVAPRSSRTRALVRVRAGQENRGLEHERGGQLARAPQVAERLQDPEVRDEEGADSERDTATDLRDAVLDPDRPARDASRGCGDERLAAGVPGTAWPEEERDLDSRIGAQPRELADLVVGQHHHAASLGDPPHRDGASLRFVEHGLEDARALHGRDLDAVAQAVGESQLGHESRP